MLKNECKKPCYKINKYFFRLLLYPHIQILLLGLFFQNFRLVISYSGTYLLKQLILYVDFVFVYLQIGLYVEMFAQIFFLLFDASVRGCARGR